MFINNSLLVVLTSIVCFISNFSHGEYFDVEKFFWNDYTYIEPVKSSYKIHTTPQNWFDAKHECAKEGASLYYPENNDEDHAVTLFWNGTEPDIEWIFVEIPDLETEGFFEPMDGKSDSEVYNILISGQSNDYLGKQDCIQQNKEGKLTDHQCFVKFPFICKRRLLLEEKKTNNTDEQKEKAEFSRKDYTYIQLFNSFYKIHTAKRPWAEAKLACDEEGASLYYPENEDEQNAVMSFWNRTQPDIKWVYLGITDENTEGVFVTIDGKLLSEVYSNWKNGEPNDLDNEEDCVEQDRSGKMNDCSCDTKFNFICKKNLKSFKPNYKCSIDYSLNKDVGKCYKLQTTPLKWSEAYTVCRAEQSHLAVINNKLEAEYLAKLVQSASKQGYQQLNRGIYHLGFQYKFNEGWRTVRGAPMMVNDDAWWDNRQPIVDERDQCGSMFYNGRLTSVNCNTKSFFICEHEVHSSTDRSQLSLENEDKYKVNEY